MSEASDKESDVSYVKSYSKLVHSSVAFLDSVRQAVLEWSKVNETKVHSTEFCYDSIDIFAVHRTLCTTKQKRAKKNQH